MRKTILVVDDELFNRQIIVNALEKAEADYSVMSAPNGLVGCDLAEKVQPDLILLDWKMPELPGYEALIRLKAQESTKHIPVMMITGVTDQNELKQAFDVGLADYIAKPIDKNILLTKVADLLIP